MDDCALVYVVVNDISDEDGSISQGFVWGNKGKQGAKAKFQGHQWTSQRDLE
jgi:hypothetical protein